MSAAWSSDDLPDLAGRRALVTGAGSPLGRETALALAGRGAELLLADPDLDALGDAVRRVDAAGAARPVAVPLDLADLDSVRDAAAHARSVALEGLDLLVLHDAGRERGATTSDGEEVSLVARAWGPFLLVARLHDLLGRVVSVVPPSYRLAREVSPNLDDEGLLRRTGWGGSSEAALATLLLALELDARARAAGSGLRSLVAVAGLDVSGPLGRAEQVRRGRGPSILDAAARAVGQRGEVAHHPVLMAATADLPGSTVVGLGGALGLGTTPRIVNPPRTARDRELRRRLWTLAVERAGAEPWA